MLSIIIVNHEQNETDFPHIKRYAQTQQLVVSGHLSSGSGCQCMFTIPDISQKQAVAH